MKKRVLSLLTAFCLMLTLAPAALATDGVTTATNPITVSTAADLVTAVSDTATYDVVTLGANIELSDTLTVAHAVTIDGSEDNQYSITAPSGKNAVNVTSDNVNLQNLTINASGSGYGVNATASGLTVANCAINVETRGINFYPTNSNGATLNVSGTVILNTTVSNYDTTVAYSGDNRGIATADVKGGTVTISDCAILGFKYALNPVVTPVSYLRDGNGTNFNVSGSYIVGWTALNMWSANTNFTFTDCTLIGINNLTGESNGFSTIQANDGIYGSSTDKESVVKFVGGHLYAVKYNTATQALISVDNAYQTKFVFEKYGGSSVDTVWFGIDNEGQEIYTSNFWNFYFLDYNKPEKADAYLASSKVVGYPENVLFGAGTPADYEIEVSREGGE